MNTATKNLSTAEQAVLEEARKVNEERMKAVQVLAGIVAEKSDLEERLKDNAKEERRAIRDAEKAGWTAAQIKRFMKPPRQTKRASEPDGNQPSNSELSPAAQATIPE